MFDKSITKNALNLIDLMLKNDIIILQETKFLNSEHLVAA